jgi:hypothetical protein
MDHRRGRNHRLEQKTMRARELFSLAACLTIFVGGHMVSAQALRAHEGEAGAKSTAEQVDARSNAGPREVAPGR